MGCYEIHKQTLISLRIGLKSCFTYLQGPIRFHREGPSDHLMKPLELFPKLLDNKSRVQYNWITTTHNVHPPYPLLQQNPYLLHFCKPTAEPCPLHYSPLLFTIAYSSWLFTPLPIAHNIFKKKATIKNNGTEGGEREWDWVTEREKEKV